MATLMELNVAAKTKAEAMVGLLDKIDGETNPTKEQLDAWNGERVGLQGELKSLNEQIVRLEARSEAEDIIARANRPLGGMRHAHGAGQKTLLDFPESEEFKSWLKAVAPMGEILGGGNVRLQNSQAMFLNSGYKALLTGTTTWSPRSDVSASALVPLDQRGLLDEGVWRRPLRIADFISKGETTGDTIEFVRITGVTNSAAPVAEATAAGGTSGAKPMSEMAFQVIHERVKTVAHWIPVTRRALTDASQIRTLLENFLRYGLAEELEDQIVAGDGTGENFTGVLNVTGKLDQAWVDDRLTTARKAITNLLLNGRVMPTAWAMHPTDWEAFDLEQDNEARYYFGGPMSPGQPTLWGVPVVQSQGVPVGTPILADWRFAQLWDREQATILVSDSHSDFFTRNLLAVLAEFRAAFGVIRPQAFCEVDLTA